MGAVTATANCTWQGCCEGDDDNVAAPPIPQRGLHDQPAPQAAVVENHEVSRGWQYKPRTGDHWYSDVSRSSREEGEESPHHSPENVRTDDESSPCKTLQHYEHEAAQDLAEQIYKKYKNPSTDLAESELSTTASPIINDAVSQSEIWRHKAAEHIERAKQEDIDPTTKKMEMVEAWRTLNTSIRLDPLNARARFLMVSCAMDSGDYIRAKDEGLILHSQLGDKLATQGDPVIHLSIAHAARELGDWDLAIRFATEASGAFPEDPRPRMVLAELLSQHGQPKAAEHEAREALRLNDSADASRRLSSENMYSVLCCIGEVLSNREEWVPAEDFLQRALKLDGTQPRAPQLLVRVYVNQQRKEEAREMASRVVALSPDDALAKTLAEVLCSSPRREPPPASTASSGRSPAWLLEYDTNSSVASCPSGLLSLRKSAGPHKKAHKTGSQVVPQWNHTGGRGPSVTWADGETGSHDRDHDLDMPRPAGDPSSHANKARGSAGPLPTGQHRINKPSDGKTSRDVCTICCFERD